ncbi:MULTISPECIES: AraC family transcriptional regulator [unclassified Sinorhizobium]|uniref:AraC family transcriptional regulator n=1 Tax=unclassified Sinorhizobium TaxID=2613772 RepID=UPI0035268D83
MDILSRIIELAHLQPVLDIRCRLEGAFEIDHALVEKGSMPFHLILGGSCIIETGSGGQFVLQSGDFLLLPRGDAHAIRGRDAKGSALPLRISREGMLPLRQNGQGEADVDLLCGHFDFAPGSSRLLLDALPDPFHASLVEVQSEETLKTLAGLLRHETTLEQPGALTIVTAICLALFVMALRQHGSTSFERPGLLALLANPRLGKSVARLVAEPGHRWTIDELARLCAMSRATYARQFRECTGMTVGSFLTDWRMAIAGDRLLQTQRSIADIAAEVGYESEAAFGKAFKSSTGLTPGRFRREAV